MENNKLLVDFSLRTMLQWLLISHKMQIVKPNPLQSTWLLFHIQVYVYMHVCVCVCVF